MKEEMIGRKGAHINPNLSSTKEETIGKWVMGGQGIE